MANTNLTAGIKTLIPFAERFEKEVGNDRPLQLLNAAIILAEKLDEKIAAISTEEFTATEAEILRVTGKNPSPEDRKKALDLIADPKISKISQLKRDIKQIKDLENEALEIMRLRFTEADLNKFREQQREQTKK